MDMLKEHPLLFVPLGMVYAVIGIVVGLFLKYKVEYHIRMFGDGGPDDDPDAHGFCWCGDNELRAVVRSWVSWSFAAWPLNLTVSFVIKPTIRYIMIPLFKYVLIPLFCFLVIRPVRWCMECYEQATQMATNRVRFEVQEVERAKAQRKAEEADKKKHARVDGAIARADQLLKRVDDNVGRSDDLLG
jgi:hypothetical protein